MNTSITRARLRWLALSLAGVALAAITTSAAAQTTATSPQDRYQAERAACLTGNTGQDRTTCLREAGAALHDARQGRLDNGAWSMYERNAQMRCNPLPPEQRQSCRTRMQGEGETSGSVAGGESIGELREVVPADESNATTPAPARRVQ